MSNVVGFPGVSRLDTDPQRVLDEALKAGLSEVVIVGTDAEGDEFFASSHAGAAETILHLERAKWRLMRMIDQILAGEQR